jgi:oligopeptidase F. Metallo peptidase. MEROPS family M03B
MALRKKAMKLDELHMYDLYNPLVENPYKDIPWETAQEMVVEALKTAWSRIPLAVQRGGFPADGLTFTATEGKRGGAYSWGSYATHPYILLNYNGEF